MRRDRDGKAFLRTEAIAAAVAVGVVGIVVLWGSRSLHVSVSAAFLTGTGTVAAAVALLVALRTSGDRGTGGARGEPSLAAREECDNYRSFLEHFQGIAFRGTLDFVPLLFKGAVEEITGYGEEEFLAGEPRWDQVIHSEDLLRMKGSIDRVRTLPHHKDEREYRIIRKDGQVRWVRESIRNICDDGGQPCLVQGELYDITETRRSLDALGQSEERYRRLSREFQGVLDAIPDAIMLLTTDYRVVWGNEGFRRTLAAGREGYQGRQCFDFCFGRRRACQDCPVQESVVSGGTCSARVVDESGRTRVVRTYPVERSGEVRNVIVISADITDRVRLEAEAMRSGHLASLGELAAGVAHEINNPINGIINYAQLLLEEAGPDARRQEVPERILKESRRIAGIVRSLLSFARTGDDEKEPVSIPEVLHDSLALSGAQMRKDGIRLDVEVPDNLPEVVAVRNQLQQVFLNIMNNARHALNQKFKDPDEGKVLRIEGEVLQDGDTEFLRMTFHDHGTGIPPAVHQKVLSPFFTTKGKAGTGLGLSITHSIVNEHGGRLAFESVEGSYTKVLVYLPLGG